MTAGGSLTRRALAAGGIASLAPAARPGRARADACGLALVADLALRDTDGFLTVTAGLDGLVASMLVDTGSDAGLLTPGCAHAAALAPSGERAPLAGGGGRALPVAIVPRLRLGEVLLRDVPFPLDRLPAAPMIEPSIGGLIGGDLLGHFEVEIDVSRGTLRLYAPHDLSLSCRGLPPWREPFARLDAHRQGNRLLVPVRLDGVPAQAVLDSGARSRIVSTRLARALGIQDAVLDAESGGLVRGVTGPEQTYHWHRFATFEVAGERVLHPVLTVAPLPDDEPMLLGADWFARHRVWISYATATVFVSAPGSG